MAATIAKTLCRLNFCTNGIKHLQLSNTAHPSVQSPSVLKDVYRSAWYRSFFGSDQSTQTTHEDLVSKSGNTGLSKPKKPPQVFIYYLQTIQDSIKQANPAWSRIQVIREAAERWKVLDPEKKSKLSMAIEEMKEKYLADKAHYLENRTPDQILQEEKEKGKKLTKKLKKARKTLGMPSRPQSSYQIFLSEKFSERSGEAIQKYFKQAKDQWNSLSENERNVYVQKHLQSKQQYDKEMADWEESMIEEGQFSVIRKSTLNKLKNTDSPKQSRKKK